MKQILGKVLEGIDSIKIISNSHSEFKAIEQKSDKTICTFDIEKKVYCKQLYEGYEDVYRVLNWFKFKDIDKTSISVEKCNGLNCEDCDGCAYNTLTSIFNSRKIMEKHIGSSINEYTFIGTLSLSDELIAKSSYKKYISYSSGSYVIQNISLESQNIIIEETTIPDKLFIEHYIPEVLEVPSSIKEVYGLYKNKAVIWHYRKFNARCCWIWEELK
jgi:hypothetical protein